MKLLLGELLYPVVIAVVLFVALLLFGCKYEFLIPQPTTNPCTTDKANCYSIQGEYSHLGCPGQYVTTLEVDNHVFFLSCYGTKE